MADKFFAWSDIYLGGKVEQIDTLRGPKDVVTERNIVRTGDEVTQAKLKVDKDQFDAMVEGGSIRPYPLPEGADEVTSPTEAVVRQFTEGRTGEINQDMLLELALKVPLPETEEEAEAQAPAVPKGA